MDETSSPKRKARNPAQVAAERRILERRLYLSKLRLAGQTNQHQLAERLGVDQSTISRDWRWLDAHYERAAVENITRAKGIDVERCEAMVTGLYAQAVNGDVKSVFATVKVLERRAKLLGLDAPTKIAPTSPDGTAPFELTEGIPESERAERLAALLERIVKRTQTPTDPPTESPSDPLTETDDPETITPQE